jgi:hypothetical protein
VESGAAYVASGLTDGANGPSSANIYVSGTAHDTARADRSDIRLARLLLRGDHEVDPHHRCDFHDNGGSGPNNQDHNIYMEGRDHVIANSVVTGAKNGYGIQLYPSSGYAVIANNTIVQPVRIVGGQVRWRP